MGQLLLTTKTFAGLVYELSEVIRRSPTERQIGAEIDFSSPHLNRPVMKSDRIDRELLRYRCGVLTDVEDFAGKLKVLGNLFKIYCNRKQDSKKSLTFVLQCRPECYMELLFDSA